MQACANASDAPWLCGWSGFPSILIGRPSNCRTSKARANPRSSCNVAKNCGSPGMYSGTRVAAGRNSSACQRQPATPAIVSEAPINCIQRRRDIPFRELRRRLRKLAMQKLFELRRELQLVEAPPVRGRRIRAGSGRSHGFDLRHFESHIVCKRRRKGRSREAPRPRPRSRLDRRQSFYRWQVEQSVSERMPSSSRTCSPISCFVVPCGGSQSSFVIRSRGRRCSVGWR